jgi:hypothetical protein
MHIVVLRSLLSNHELLQKPFIEAIILRCARLYHQVIGDIIIHYYRQMTNPICDCYQHFTSFQKVRESLMCKFILMRVENSHVSFDSYQYDNPWFQYSLIRARQRLHLIRKEFIYQRNCNRNSKEFRELKEAYLKKMQYINKTLKQWQHHHFINQII